MSRYCSVAQAEQHILPAFVVRIKSNFPVEPTGDNKSYSGYMNECIDTATAMVNIRLSAKFSVPFTTAPAVIAQITSLLAAYEACKRNSEDEDVVKDKFYIAVDLMKQILENGVIPASDDSEVAVEASSTPLGNAPLSTSDDQYFTDTELSRW